MNARMLIPVRCSMANPPPRKISLRSRALPFAVAVELDMRDELTIGHDCFLFYQRPKPLAERRDFGMPFRLHALRARNRNVDDLAHAARPARQHADTIREADGFLKIM